MIDLLRRSKGFIGYLTALCGVIAVTSILIPLREHTNSTIVALLLLLVVLLVATVWGSRPALVASLLGVLSFNFFFLPPLYTLTISEPQNWIALFVFFVVAITVGQLSAKAKRRAEEAERLYEELEDAFEKASQAEALRRSEKLKSALLDAVTHDLRTPLTSIKASVTTLIEDAKKEEAFDLDDESRAEFLEIIDEETDRLNNFIGGIVDLAKVEAGDLHLRRVWTPVEEIIDNAIVRAQYRLESHHITIETERELPAILVDANSIAEVVYTLLDNAAKYSPEASRIRIAACRSVGETMEISVEDEGRGLAIEMREKVFDKFFRVSESDIHSTGSGLGLGLAIARRIVESQGGQIWIEDGRDNFVTRVVFRIPIGDE